MQQLDIVPELKKKIEDTFKDLIKKDGVLSSLQKKISSGKGTYEDAHAYAGEIAKCLQKAFKAHLSADQLPNGRFYYNMASRIIPDSLKTNHRMISDACVSVQDSLNASAGLRIQAQTAPLNESRVSGLASRVSQDDFEKTKWLLDSPIENFCRSIVDDHAKANADFHYRSGLRPKIVRKTAGHCCEWCANLAGSYDYYPDMNRDVFRRHDNCRCTVVYNPGDGSRRVQDVWDKRWKQNGSELEKRTEEKYNETKKLYGAYYGSWTDKNDPLGEKRDTIAEDFYNQIRKRNRDYEITALFANLKHEGFTRDDVDKVFAHVFELEHYFLNKNSEGLHIRRFDPSFDMMQSYIRLREGKKIQPHDLILMYHEREEARIMSDSLKIPYETVHDEVEKIYNYSKALKEYRKKHPKGEV